MPPAAHRSCRSPCCRPSVCSARWSLRPLWLFCFCCGDRAEPQRAQRTPRPDTKSTAASSALASRLSGLQSASRSASAWLGSRCCAAANPPLRLRASAPTQPRIHAPDRRASRSPDSEPGHERTRRTTVSPALGRRVCAHPGPPSLPTWAENLARSARRWQREERRRPQRRRVARDPVSRADSSCRRSLRPSTPWRFP
jgi:hypothetical protein